MNYIKTSINEIKSTRVIAIAAILVAIDIAISAFFIPIPLPAGEQRVYFSFLVSMLGGFIYGPFVAIFASTAADLIGYMLHPVGSFFPGYTISAIGAGLIYALFLYKQKITIFRILLCKLTSNILVNTLMNALWSSFFVEKGYIVLVIARLPKNLYMLPLEVIMACIMFKIITPYLKKEKIINYTPFDGKLKWF